MSSLFVQAYPVDLAECHPSSPTRRCVLAFAIANALALGSQALAAETLYPPELELLDLDGSDGFVINGESVLDQAGRSVASAGDLNGDGFGDVIVGADSADVDGGFDVGRAYVLFGTDSDVQPSIDLSSLDGLNGFALNGEMAFDRSGRSVGRAGDINGDGIDDLIIGADRADPNGGYSGRSYVVFGSNLPFPSSVELSSLTGSNGFAINGASQGDQSGVAVSAAGDINGDGLDDLIIGAYRASPGGRSSAGRSYVVFGSTAGFVSPLEISSLDGTNGFALDGEAAGDRSGFSVSAAGDINADGIDDLVLGAYRADGKGKTDAGRSYVVFGTNSAFPATLDLSTLNGSTGFVVEGVAAYDGLGRSVSAAGDVNGDGIDDVLIGAYRADAIAGPDAGRSYVLFGSPLPFASPFDPAVLDGVNGLVLVGGAANELAGQAVSSAGDFTGDGIDDLIIGAYGAAPNGSYSGQSFLVFGSTESFPAAIELSLLDGNIGLALNGAIGGDRSGNAVDGAGDFNGDGIADVIIGARRADANGNTDAGRSYLVFGRRPDRLFLDRFEDD